VYLNGLVVNHWFQYSWVRYHVVRFLVINSRHIQFGLLIRLQFSLPFCQRATGPSYLVNLFCVPFVLLVASHFGRDVCVYTCSAMIRVSSLKVVGKHAIGLNFTTFAVLISSFITKLVLPNTIQSGIFPVVIQLWRRSAIRLCNAVKF